MTAIPTAPATTLPAAEDDRRRARRAVVPVGVGTVLVVCALTFLRADSRGESLTMAPFGLLVGALLYGVVVPRALRHASAPGRALGFGLASVVCFPAFWSGLPLLFGTTAALLGYAGKRASTGSTRCVVGLVLGTLAVVAIVALYTIDWIQHPGASWLVD